MPQLPDAAPATDSVALSPRGFPLLLNAAFRLWWRSLPATLPLSLPIALLAQPQRVELPTLDALQSDPDLLIDWVAPLFQAHTWWLFAALSLAALWLHAAVVLRLAGQHRGAAVTLPAALWLALRRLPGFAVTVLLYGLLCALPMLPMLGIMAWLGLQGLDLPALMLASVLISLLFSLPVCWVAIRLMLAPYAAALDGDGPLASLRTASAAVAGSWWLAMAYVSMPLLAFLGVGFVAAAAPALVALLPGAEASSLALDWSLRALGVIGTALVWPLLHASLVVLHAAAARRTV
ncbi:MAG: hypothetical protein MEQ07_06320 [Aquimonas sp.]|nr:hypothetical protein [Aquimonas sp.]